MSTDDTRPEGAAVEDDAKGAAATIAETGAVDIDVDVEPVDDAIPTTREQPAEAAPATDEKSAPADRASAGPFDEAEANPVRPYIDLGGIKVLPREGLNLRLEIEEDSQRIVAVGLDYAGSTLQVQAFAAPRTAGVWHETRAQLADQIRQQGGRAQERSGALGPELIAEVPVVVEQGSAGMRVARFVGVDGPRWFLRGVIGGAAATDPETAAQVEDLFRSLVVVRGSAPMPPRELLALKMPAAPGSS